MGHYADPTSQLVAEVFVKDIRRSLDFYQALGFQRKAQRAGFAVLTWDDCELFLDERPDLPEPPAHPRANVRVMVPDVDRFWDLASEIGAVVLEPIADRHYGLRDFTILDPDGFGIRFGTWLVR
jgi:catechol 2,3-dioxygenase-like lactoylglutathione lyase family enzyme